MMLFKKDSWRWQLGLAGAAAIALAAPAVANHSWNGYHWARTTAELTIPVGDNVDASWDSYLNTAIADWNQSTVINSPKVPGSAGDPKQCNPVAGTIQVCNAKYGQRGWLGIASIWLSNGHISQGTTKLNDSYFTMAQYNNPGHRELVTCQEVGHDYGLAHQDEAFNNVNLGSCMDYTNAPSGGVVNGFNYGPANRHPNAHDYQQLLDIYNHMESGAVVSGRNSARGASGSGDSPAEWGRAVHLDGKGRPDTYIRQLGQGQYVVTHVSWAGDEGPRGLN